MPFAFLPGTRDVFQTWRHHATRFPNPERNDCPPPGQLTGQIWTGQLPNEVSRQHLLACSVCFKEYRAQLAAYQATQPAVPNWWQQWLQGWRVKPALALTFILLVSLAAGEHAAPNTNCDEYRSHCIRKFAATRAASANDCADKQAGYGVSPAATARLIAAHTDNRFE